MSAALGQSAPPSVCFLGVGLQRCGPLPRARLPSTRAGLVATNIPLLRSEHLFFRSESSVSVLLIGVMN
jgi:hypothetical protein